MPRPAPGPPAQRHRDGVDSPMRWGARPRCPREAGPVGLAVTTRRSRSRRDVGGRSIDSACPMSGLRVGGGLRVTRYSSAGASLVPVLAAPKRRAATPATAAAPSSRAVAASCPFPGASSPVPVLGKAVTSNAPGCETPRTGPLTATGAAGAPPVRSPTVDGGPSLPCWAGRVGAGSTRGSTGGGTMGPPGGPPGGGVTGSLGRPGGTVGGAEWEPLAASVSDGLAPMTTTAGVT